MNHTCDNYIVPAANYQITIGSSYATADEHGYQTMSLQTTIALNLTSLRGTPDRVAFSWGFRANSLSNITDSRAVSIHSSVGGYQFTDDLSTQLGYPTNGTHWGDDRHFLHSGILDVFNADGTVLVDVAIHTTVFQVPQEWYNLMFRRLDLTLGPVEPTSTTERISSTSGVITSLYEPVTDTSELTTSAASTKPFLSETSTVAQEQEKINVAAIIGGTLGGIAVLLLILAVLLLWRRRRFRRGIAVQNVYKPQAMPLDEIPLEVVEVSRGDVGGYAEPYSPPPAVISHQITRSRVAAAWRASKIEAYTHVVPMESPPSYLESSSPGTEATHFSHPYSMGSPVSHQYFDRMIIE